MTDKAPRIAAAEALVRCVSAGLKPFNEISTAFLRIRSSFDFGFSSFLGAAGASSSFNSAGSRSATGTEGITPWSCRALPLALWNLAIDRITAPPSSIMTGLRIAASP